MYANQILEELRAFWEAANWREELHPRASDGKFGSGGPSPSSSTSKPAGKAKTGGAGKAVAAKSAAPKKAPAAKKPPAAKKAPAAPPPPPPPAKDQAWLDSHYSGYQKSLTPGQRKALSGYQGADYAVMNAQLRSQGKHGVKDDRFDDEEMARAARANRAMNDAIKKAPPLDEPMTVYRTMTAAQAASLAAGETMGDKGFVSTSISPRKTSRGATVEVALPAGTRAAIGDGGEMILPASGRFRVLAVEEGPTGRPHVRMEFVPYGSSKSSKAAPAAAAPEAPATKAPAAKTAPAKAPAKAAPSKAAEPAPADVPAPKRAPTRSKTPAPAKAAPETLPSPPTTGMRAALRHKSDAAGKKWVAENLPLPDLTNNERTGLIIYSGSSYEIINKALRSGSTDNLKRSIEEIDGAFAKSKAPESFTVHRGVGQDYLERLGVDPNDPDSFEDSVGKILKDEAYVSTSVGKKAAFDLGVQMMIRVPEGYPAINMRPVSKNKTENEVLLPRGTQWVIHSTYKGADGRVYVEAEVVPEGWERPADWVPDPYGDVDTGYKGAK